METSSWGAAWHPLPTASSRASAAAGWRGVNENKEGSRVPLWMPVARSPLAERLSHRWQQAMQCDDAGKSRGADQAPGRGRERGGVRRDSRGDEMPGLSPSAWHSPGWPGKASGEGVRGRPAGRGRSPVCAGAGGGEGHPALSLHPVPCRRPPGGKAERTRAGPRRGTPGGPASPSSHASGSRHGKRKGNRNRSVRVREGAAGGAPGRTPRGRPGAPRPGPRRPMLQPRSFTLKRKRPRPAFRSVQLARAADGFGVQRRDTRTFPALQKALLNGTR